MSDNQASNQIDLSKLPGIMVVLSGPAASGKNTLANGLLAREGSRLWESISCTSRNLRPGEADGKHYHQMTRAEFLQQTAAGYFLEHAEFSGNLYGTPASPVIEHLKQGIDVLVIAEVQGTAQIRERVSDVVTIFVMPEGITPAEQEQHMRQRLGKRGTETPEQVERRIRTALTQELPQAPLYDHRVINPDGQLEAATSKLHAILEAARQTHARRLANA